ncbi:hypothetical protein BFP72_06690 [Reichenbachiella sp. 5M10]|uniref:S41 family peptidase n=1 Tax=Reichenbachiella sp. 5M10 TaxID=1889772 RepID=UPI000C1508DD|nr:S41 family peptidase [Reichenbachiella sp. 5M10]PIB35105.1 hypothetical protein BFP72_06690 [Reichenbachiella sp. 5M10]
MKIKHFPLVVFLMVAMFCSCEKITMHPNPDQDNESLFDEYAKVCIEKFGLTEVKGIDLVSLRDSIRPYINNQLSDSILFNYMAIMTVRMQEGHTSLEDLEHDYYANWAFYLGYPSAFKFLLPQNYYYGKEANPNVQIISEPDSLNEILYGFLPQDHEIGYIRVTNFDMDVSDSELEEMMRYLKDAKGIIVDVRNNLGGYVNLAARMAAYFTDEEVIFANNYVKNGPGQNDFALSKMKLSPTGSPYTFTKNVAVLQDRITFSAGSLFCVMMYSLDHVTTLGQPFGGGTGEIVDGFLSNGWRYNLSTSNMVDSQGRPTDNGIEADIPMVVNPEDTTVDVIIDRAILELQ